MRIKVHVQPGSPYFVISADQEVMDMLREGMEQVISDREFEWDNTGDDDLGLQQAADEVTHAKTVADALDVVRCPSCPVGIVGRVRTHKMGCHFEEQNWKAKLH